MSFSTMLNRLHGQPESYSKKSKYRFGKNLGAGTYGVVRRAEGPEGPVAVKVIPKKQPTNNNLVFSELDLLQRVKHPHIIKFFEWFESRDKFYIVTELAEGGEVFDRICEIGKYTEKDAMQTIKQVLSAVAYLHSNNIVHRDLKPENLLYLRKDPESDVVLADFGIAKTIGTKEVLKTMAGSFGYAAPEVMEDLGHGKPADMWSMGVITFTLLCGYSPFKSSSIEDLKRECHRPVEYMERYWKDVSDDARDFINLLMDPIPERRPTCQQALEHIWLSGLNATDHDLGEPRRVKLRALRWQRAINRAKLQMLFKETNDAEFGDADLEGATPDNAKPEDVLAAGAHCEDARPEDAKPEDAKDGKISLQANDKGSRFLAVALAAMLEQKNQKETEEALQEEKQ